MHEAVKVVDDAPDQGLDVLRGLEPGGEALAPFAFGDRHDGLGLPALAAGAFGLASARIPAPWPGNSRLGDNLYTSSVVALDADTGELKGYHQYQDRACERNGVLS